MNPSLKELLTNPFAWIIPLVMLYSFLVNHKTPSSGSGDGSEKSKKSEPKNQDAPKQQKQNSTRPADNGDAGLISADDTEST